MQGQESKKDFHPNREARKHPFRQSGFTCRRRSMTQFADGGQSKSDPQRVLVVRSSTQELVLSVRGLLQLLLQQPDIEAHE